MMLDKLRRYIDKETFEACCKELGAEVQKTQVLPQPLREVSVDTFLLAQLDGHGLYATSFGQGWITEEERKGDSHHAKFYDFHYYWFRLNCYVLVSDYWNKPREGWYSILSPGGYNYHMIRVFKIGCDHRDYVVTDDGWEMHYVCKSCGKKWSNAYK